MGTIVTSGRSGQVRHHVGQAGRAGGAGDWPVGRVGGAGRAGRAGRRGCAGRADRAFLARRGWCPRCAQVAIRFDEPMVPMGDLNAAPPAAVSCTGGAAAASGRWVNATNWVFDFERDLPPGMRCTVRIAGGLKSVAGKAYAGKPEYRFEDRRAHEWSRPGLPADEVEEDQVFVLRFQRRGHGRVDPRTRVVPRPRALGEHSGAACWPARNARTSDRGGRLERDRQTGRRGGAPAGLPAEAAGRRADAARARCWASPRPPASATTAPRRFDYTVREAFAAGFTCERERAEAPCTPLRPMTVTFTAPIPRKVAEHIVLNTPPARVRRPSTDSRPMPRWSRSAFTAPFPERASPDHRGPA